MRGLSAYNSTSLLRIELRKSVLPAVSRINITAMHAQFVSCQAAHMARGLLQPHETYALVAHLSLNLPYPDGRPLSVTNPFSQVH